MWTKKYRAVNLDLDQAAAEVAARLGIELEPRYSSYGGRYYRWRELPNEVSVRENVVDGGELTGGDLTYPELPEGVLVSIATEQAGTFRDEMNHPEFELYETKQFERRQSP